MKLKICGMKYPENIYQVGQLLPDYMGFIFWEKSSRYFDGELPSLPVSIQKTGVFVDAAPEEIIAKIEQYQLDLVQLHGTETPDIFRKIRHKSVQTIKVFSIDEDFDFAQIEPYLNVCDYFLFDTKGKLPGGNGNKFDWDILQKYIYSKPIFLSGGIGPEDISAIKKLALPIHAIDVNSRFELAPGLKDYELLRQFQIQLL